MRAAINTPTRSQDIATVSSIPLTRIPRQSATAFGSFGQGRAIPAAAEGLDEGHCAHHAAAENIHRSDFVGESRTLSGCHLQVAGDTALVTRDGEFKIFLSGRDGFVLNLSFMLENPQCSYVVLYLLKAGQHGLAIIGDSLIVSSGGLV